MDVFMNVSTWLATGGTGLLVSWTLKASAILAAAGIAAIALSRASAASRHRVWLAAVACALLLPVLETLLPAWKAVPAEWSAVGAVDEAAKEPLGAVAAIPVAATGEDPARTATPVRGVAAPRVDAGGAIADRPVPRPSSNPRARPASSSASGTAGGRSGSSITAWPLGIVMAWALGAVAWLLLVGRGLFLAGRAYGNARSAPVHVADLTCDLAATLGVRRPVTVRVSDQIPVPATWGVLRPRILLPDSAVSWDRERLSRVLLHELAHVRRRDWAAGLMGEALRAVQWFNPLAWVAARSMRLEQEQACDDWVLTSGARASDYARDLVSVARSFMRRPVADPTVFLTRSSKLSKRVSALLDPRRSRSRARGALMTLLALLAFLPIATLASASPAAKASESSGGVDEVAPPEARAPVARVRAVTSPRPDNPLIPAVDAPEPTPEPASSAESIMTGVETVATGIATIARDAFGLTLERLQPGPRALGGQIIETCAFQGDAKHSSSVNVNGRGEWDIQWSTDDCRVDVELKGEVTFNAAEDGVESLSRNGSLEIEERMNGVRRRLVVEMDDGDLVYRYWLDRREMPFEGEARAWLAAFLPQLFRHTTIQAEERVARIMERSGTDGVLEEVGRIRSDHVAARYLGLLMEHRAFEPDRVPDVLGVVAERVDSDHYASQILSTVATRWGIRPEYQAPYLDAVRGIESDHYVHETLMALLERDDLTPVAVEQVLEEAARNTSDHYTSRILIKAAELGVLETTQREIYLRALERMESDHYQHEVVSALLDNATVDAAEAARLIELTETIGSAHYRSSILTRLAGEQELAGPAINAFLRSVSGIESDHYRHEAGRAILGVTDLSEAHIGLVLDIAEGMSGDHSKADLLIELVGDHALTAAHRDRYRDIAEGMGSRHYQDQVLAALVRAER